MRHGVSVFLGLSHVNRKLTQEVAPRGESGAPWSQTAPCRRSGLRHSDFLRASVFGFRISSLITRHSPQRRGQADAGAAFGAWANDEFAADVFEAFAHIAQAVAAFVGGVGAEAAAVVFDFEGEAARLQKGSNRRLVSGMSA